MPEKPELLPCPLFDWWCGGSGFMVFRGGNPGRWNVVCDKCGCTGPYGNDQVEAALGWNTRAPSELERLARAFFGKVTEIGPIIDGIIGVQTARGYPYTGPNWKAEYDALAAFLAEPQVTK